MAIIWYCALTPPTRHRYPLPVMCFNILYDFQRRLCSSFTVIGCVILEWSTPLYGITRNGFVPFDQPKKEYLGHVLFINCWPPRPRHDARWINKNMRLLSKCGGYLLCATPNNSLNLVLMLRTLHFQILGKTEKRIMRPASSRSIPPFSGTTLSKFTKYIQKRLRCSVH